MSHRRLWLLVATCAIVLCSDQGFAAAAVATAAEYDELVGLEAPSYVKRSADDFPLAEAVDETDVASSDLAKREAEYAVGEFSGGAPDELMFDIVDNARDKRGTRKSHHKHPKNKRKQGYKSHPKHHHHHHSSSDSSDSSTSESSSSTSESSSDSLDSSDSSSSSSSSESSSEEKKHKKKKIKSKKKKNKKRKKCTSDSSSSESGATHKKGGRFDLKSSMGPSLRKMNLKKHPIVKYHSKNRSKLSLHTHQAGN